MNINGEILAAAIQFLVDGKEVEAANLLRSCTFESFDIIDYSMDGSRQLDGLLIEVSCPRKTYEIITQHTHPLRKSIENAIGAILPTFILVAPGFLYSGKCVRGQ